VDTSQAAVQVSGKESRKRCFRSVEEKRRIVEETWRPGASVARVALRHGVHSHQVFGWRKLYREGRLRERLGGNAKLLPVRVVEVGEEAAASRNTKRRRSPSGLIHLELPKGHLRIAGSVDVFRTLLVAGQGGSEVSLAGAMWRLPGHRDTLAGAACARDPAIRAAESLRNGEHHLAELLTLLQIGVRQHAVMQRPDLVHNRLEPALGHQL